MVLSIIFLEDKHNIVLHLSILYEYQQFFQHRICFSIQPHDYSDPWPRLARSRSFFLLMFFNNKQYIIDHHTYTTANCLWNNFIGFPWTLKVAIFQLISSVIKDVSYKLQLKWHALPKWSSTRGWQMGGNM
jgi:hypothetical protein